MALEEFPGLMASGMRSIGRFGIGFFAVFMLGSVVRVYSRRFDHGQETGHLLEFHDGAGARPILSSNVASDCPIDGGTRVEVRLKYRPDASSGILAVTRNYSWEAISLSNLVASLAPNLDIKINTAIDNEKTVAIETGDWLRIADHTLIDRINLGASRRRNDPAESDCELMQVITGENNTIYGRACINPSVRPGIDHGGCMTIDGLRACYLHNIDGILVGKAVTAVRDSALPTVPHEVLAQWSSVQAQLIARSVQDEERQAKSAQVVLACGGNIADLKILRWGSEWLNSEEFTLRISCQNELVIGFEGEFEYDENLDEIIPRDFRENFVQSDNVLMVPDHYGWITQTGRTHWPAAHPDLSDPSPPTLAEFIRKEITQTWGSDLDVMEEEREIGRVGDTEVIRSVTTFVRNIVSKNY